MIGTPAAEYKTDVEGYLVDPIDWSEKVAEAVAAGAYGMALGPEHWEVIRFIRDYYQQNQIAPDARHVMKNLSDKYGGDGRARLYGLFPYGYMQQACKIAGMRRPRAWSTG